MSKREKILSGLSEQNKPATYEAVDGFWCQGDCVLVEAGNPMDAIAGYRSKIWVASIAINHNLFCGSILAMQRQIRIEELENAIKTHRGQKLDDRCWMDDQKLYATLKDGTPADNSTPPKEEMLANCRRYIDMRCHPGDWKSYQRLEEENAELREQLKSMTEKAATSMARV